MSDVNEPRPEEPTTGGVPAEPTPEPGSPEPGSPAPAFGEQASPPAYDASGTAPGPVTGPVTGPVAGAPVGQVRETGMCILLTVVTLGFYSWYWYYKTHEEMRQHTGQGIGGAVALILAIFVGVVMPFFSSHEVGQLYERRGQERPVTAMTGLWALLLGWFLFVGLIVWFVKTNRALNDYWLSLGAE
jgi:hypothetical protein